MHAYKHETEQGGNKVINIDPTCDINFKRMYDVYGTKANTPLETVVRSMLAKSK